MDKVISVQERLQPSSIEFDRRNRGLMRSASGKLSIRSPSRAPLHMLFQMDDHRVVLRRVAYSKWGNVLVDSR
jgi:hypothetical protein